MVTLELNAEEHWVYVKASGFLDYWDDASYMTKMIEEARRLGLDAILYDARNVAGEPGPWQLVCNYYLLRQQLDGVRVAYVISDTAAVPYDYSRQVAKTLGVSVRPFASLNEASHWLKNNNGNRVATAC